MNASTTYITLYEYDRIGDLTKITDALGNIRNFTYDGLGRRLTAEDLHASGDVTYGTWTFTYDDAGNLTSQLDPKSQTVNFSYDALNRVKTEDYTGQTGTEIVYIYDSCSEGIMRLCAASTTAATTTFTYWANGLKKTETQQVGTSTATTTFAYDRQGNIFTLTYPDKAQTVYRYNNAGLVDAVDHKESGVATSTLMENINYGPHGKVTYENFFNNTVSTSTYDINALWRLTYRNTVNNQVQGMSWVAPLRKLLGLGRLFLPRPLLAYADAEELPDPEARASTTDETVASLDLALEEPAGSAATSTEEVSEAPVEEAAPLWHLRAHRLRWRWE